MESTPWHPALAATSVAGYGAAHESLMRETEHSVPHMAICIDGFHEDVVGGRVTLRSSGAPVLDYPFPPKLWEAFRFAQKKLAQMQFAAGAKRVRSLHDDPVVMILRMQ
jgi:hypothetical protein